jgi:chemotaxis protein CheD
VRAAAQDPPRRRSAPRPLPDAYEVFRCRTAPSPVLLETHHAATAFVAVPPDRIFLSSGTLFCAPTPSVIITVLGSCVAVCLWDAHEHVGGMNHYLLPRRMEELASPRFGDVAITQLVDGMTELGCRIGSLRAKVFGGAEVLPFGARGDTVGNQNVRIALEQLRRHGIPILTRCTGGRTGMLIRLYSETGDVAVRRVAAAHQADGVQFSA